MSPRTKLLRLTAVACMALAAAGCGGGESDEEAEAEEAGRGTITCEGAALTGATNLPASFPKLDEITYVEAERRGPTAIVDGYYEGSLEEAYEEYKDAFEGAGYEILFDEIEEDDSEVSYRADDQTEGIVALRTCDNDNISVHITNRPE